MKKTVSKLRGFVKSCCRLLSTKSPNPRQVDLKHKVVYGGDLRIPTYKNSFGSLLFFRLLKMEKNNQVLQVCSATKTVMTAKNFLQKAVSVAQRLKDENIKKGDYVVLVGDNSFNLNVTMIGIFFLGAVPVPVAGRTQREELRIFWKSLHPKFFFIDKRYVLQIMNFLDEVADTEKPKLCLLNQKKGVPDKDIETFGEFTKGGKKNVDLFTPAEITDPQNELALVLKAFTKGSLGRLIGITHQNMNSIIARFDTGSRRKLEKHVVLMVQRLSRMSGVYSLMFSCCYGAKLILLNKFSEENFMQAVEDHKVTVTIMYTPKLWLLYKYDYGKEYDVSSLKYILSVDGSIPKNLVEGLKDKLGVTVRPSFSINELTGLVLQPLTEESSGSTGKLVPEMYGKVVSVKTNHKVGPMELGIICFKGPSLTKGYINDRRSTQLLFDKEGFLVSEMYGYYDQDGNFYIIDKLHHVIRHKNCEISPRELEGIILSLREVRDVAVAGIQHSEDGYCPIALVVLQPKAKLTSGDIIKHVEGLVEDCKKLRGGVIFVTKIPRSRENGVIKRYLINKILTKYRIPSQVPLKSATSVPM